MVLCVANFLQQNLKLNVIKINTDAPWNHTDNSAGIAVIVRDSNGV